MYTIYTYIIVYIYIYIYIYTYLGTFGSAENETGRVRARGGEVGRDVCGQQVPEAEALWLWTNGVNTNGVTATKVLVYDGFEKVLTNHCWEMTHFLHAGPLGRGNWLITSVHEEFMGA